MDEFEAGEPRTSRSSWSAAPTPRPSEQIVAGAASGTLADVVGLDGAWVNDLAKQGAIADLSTLMKDAAGYDDSQLADARSRSTGQTYMIPVRQLRLPAVHQPRPAAKAAGVDQHADDPHRVRRRGQEDDRRRRATRTAGSCRCRWRRPNGIQNDVMSWVWASGGSMLKDGKPDVTNEAVVERARLHQVSSTTTASSRPAPSTMKEQDKVEEFTNGRVGMMIDSLAHINLIRETQPGPELRHHGDPGRGRLHRQARHALRLVGHRRRGEQRAQGGGLEARLVPDEQGRQRQARRRANAFPGNVNAVPGLRQVRRAVQGRRSTSGTPATPANEFVGLPVAEELMRELDERAAGACSRATSPSTRALPDAQDAVGRRSSDRSRAQAGRAGRACCAGAAATKEATDVRHDAAPTGAPASRGAPGAARQSRRGVVARPTRADAVRLPDADARPAGRPDAPRRSSWSSRYSLMDHAIISQGLGLRRVRQLRRGAAGPGSSHGGRATRSFFAGVSVVVHFMIGLAFALLLNTDRARAPSPRRSSGRSSSCRGCSPSRSSRCSGGCSSTPTASSTTCCRPRASPTAQSSGSADPHLALPAVTFINIWAGYPFFMVSLLAGLQGIPRDLYEAARVDGAGAGQAVPSTSRCRSCARSSSAWRCSTSSGPRSSSR